MRRCFFVLIALILATTFLANKLLAQETDLTSYGAQVGLNMAKLGGSDSSPAGVDKKFKTGLAAGFFATYGLTPMFAIQGELNYTMKGVKYSSASATRTIKLDYLEIPILAKLVFGTAGNIKPDIFAGPSFGFRLSAKDKVEGSVLTSDSKLDSLTNGTDMGLMFGAGVGYKMTSGKIFLNGRYTLGLSKISKTNWTLPSGKQYDLKNNVITIMLGYAFI